MQRRKFIKASIGIAATAAAGGLLFPQLTRANENKPHTTHMKKILILNGSPRKNGKTASLVNAFREGAESAGNQVQEFYLQGMHIGGCLACEACSRNGGKCVQKDDMEQVNDAFLWADVVVFASPQFWGTISGQQKIVIDRFYALQNRIGMASFKKESVFIMTSRGEYYDMAKTFYGLFQAIDWKDLGMVLGAGKEDEARQLGASIGA